MNIPSPIYKYDIAPQDAGTKQGDCRCLPFADSSIKSECIDLPFLNTKPIHETRDNDIMHKRFSYVDGMDGLWGLYKDAIKEAYRILVDGGILMFKCQDMVSSGKQYLTHVEIINYAIKIGFYPVDMFVLLSKHRIISGKHKNQKHARKYHSYFMVFKKMESPVKYN